MNAAFDVIRWTALIALFGIWMAGPLSAHPGHDDPITKDAAVQRASTEINRLVDSGKLHKSWKLNAALKIVELRPRRETKEWAVIFSNPEALKESERTLYVFLTEQGEYLAANFTGK